MLIEQAVKSEHVDVASKGYHPVADVGQTAGRGGVHLMGSLPCLASSTRIFSFKLRRRRVTSHNNLFMFVNSLCSHWRTSTQVSHTSSCGHSELRFLLPSELMSSLGFTAYSFEGLTENQAVALAGRGMSATTLAIVLIPLLYSLGFLRKA